VNRVFAAFPAWIVCTYDACRLPDRVLEAAWRAHPEVLSGDWQRSARFEDPAALARAVTPAAAPLPGLDDLHFGTSAETLREALSRALAAARVPDGKALGMLLAASEVAANAWRHSGGPTAVRAGRADGRFVCEIADGGAGFDDPLAGFIPAAPGEQASGLSVARRLTWRLEHYRSPTGFTVRLWL
jgi:anti-sigma regulatory factor (Ser/Thr protein kinase)